MPNFFKGYLWVLYLGIIALFVYYFRGPLKAYDKMESCKYNYSLFLFFFQVLQMINTLKLNSFEFRLEYRTKPKSTQI